MKNEGKNEVHLKIINMKGKHFLFGICDYIFFVHLVKEKKEEKEKNRIAKGKNQKKKHTYTHTINDNMHPYKFYCKGTTRNESSRHNPTIKHIIFVLCFIRVCITT